MRLCAGQIGFNFAQTQHELQTKQNCHFAAKMATNAEDEAKNAQPRDDAERFCHHNATILLGPNALAWNVTFFRIINQEFVGWQHFFATDPRMPMRNQFLQLFKRNSFREYGNLLWLGSKNSGNHTNFKYVCCSGQRKILRSTQKRQFNRKIPIQGARF